MNGSAEEYSEGMMNLYNVSQLLVETEGKNMKERVVEPVYHMQCEACNAAIHH